MNMKGNHSYLKYYFEHASVDSVMYPKHSPELDHVKLSLNMTVQIFIFEFNSKNKTGKEALSLLTNVIESISPDVSFSYYKRCEHTKNH